jgi:hypothetical protein
MNASTLITQPAHLRNLASSGVILTYDLTTYTGQVAANKHSARISAEAGAKENVLTTTQQLFKNDPDLKHLLSYRQTLSHWHHAITLPWAPKHGFLLIEKIPEARTQLDEWVRDFDRAADKFCATLEEKIARQAFIQGDLFNRAAYPDPRRIRRRYSLTYNIIPVPEMDYRNAISADLAADLATHYTRQLDTVLAMQQADMVRKLSKTLNSLANTCTVSTSVDDDGKQVISKGRVHASTISKAIQLCHDLNAYLPSNDPTTVALLNDTADALRAALFTNGEAINPAAVQQSITMRDTVREAAERAKAILSPLVSLTDLDEDEA